MEESIFENRVVLEKDFQTRLFTLYTRYGGGVTDAAKRLGLKPTTFYAYRSYQSKSVPEEVLDRILDDTRHTWLQLTLEFGDKEDIRMARRKLSAMRAASLNQWRSKDRQRALDAAKDASAKGLKALQDKLGPDWKNKATEPARKALKKKYGTDAFKVIGRMGPAGARKKHGERLGEVISEREIKGLKEKHGENYKEILGVRFEKSLEKTLGPDWAKAISEMGHDALREKFGNNFAGITLMRARRVMAARYGDNYLDKIRKEGVKSVKRRREILHVIESGEASTSFAIAALTKLEADKVTKGLKVLLRRGEIVRQVEGNTVCYSPARLHAR